MPWNPISVSGVFSPLTNRPGQHGHCFTVVIQLRHTPAAGPLAPLEEPKLVWHEDITGIDLRNQSVWHWQGDLYAYRPNAHTFETWRFRYVEAYHRAAGTPVFVRNGSAALSVRGQPVTLAQIHALIPGSPRPLTDDQAKAEAVRHFIAQNDCVLTVSIVDRPSLGITTAQNPRERLLEFRCGVGTHTVHAHQHLRVSATGLTPPLPDLLSAAHGAPAPRLVSTQHLRPDAQRTLFHEYSDLGTSRDALSLRTALGHGAYR